MTAEDLRQALTRHDAAEAARRERADAARARLVAQLADAERADRVDAARARLLAEAEHHDRESARLSALADAIAARLAEADGELERLRGRRDELAATMRTDAAEAERLLTSDPEQAGALGAQNLGRQLALHGLDQAIAEAQRQRETIASGADIPPEPDAPLVFHGDVDPRDVSLDGLRKRAAWHRGEAQRLRWQAQDDPLVDGAEASAGEPEGTPSGAVLAGVLLAARRGFRELSPSRPARPFGFAPGSLGAATESAPRRRRR